MNPFYRAKKIRNITSVYVILEREGDYLTFWKNDDTETYINANGYGIISQNDSGISQLLMHKSGVLYDYLYHRVWSACKNIVTVTHRLPYSLYEEEYPEK